MKSRLILVCLLLMSLRGLHAQEPAPDSAAAAKEDPAHEELREFRKQVVKAIADNDIDSLLTHLTDNVVVTWQNAEISRGPEEVRKYYDRMMKGPNAIVKSLSSNPVPDQLTNLFGDTGVAHGGSDDHFVLTDGSEFTIHTVWSATVVKEDGGWKIASFHASTNMFDNAVLWLIVRKAAIWVGAASLVLGLVLGALFMWLTRRQRKPAHGAT